MYAWIITKVNEKEFSKKLIGLSGPRQHRIDKHEILKKGETFKIYDDDGIWYYSGKIVGDYEGFEPLDDYGEGGLGATGIKYRNKKTGKWEYI